MIVFRLACKKAILFLLLICVLCFGIWVSLVLAFSPILPVDSRIPAASLLATCILAGLCWRKIFYLPAVLAALFVCLAWSRLEPSNNREWQRDLNKLAWAEQNGDEITIHNVRDFRYKSETDFEEHYVTKKVKLSELTSTDLFASYWDGTNIAHIFVSFGFRDKDFISISIEVRKTKNQNYSTIDGFFRNYELIYVVAEERDLVGLRTIYRKPNEQVYILRLKYFKENAIKIFLQYLSNLNSLVTKAQFYNTATTNCTTQVLTNAQEATNRSGLSYDWRLLLSGHTPEYLYSKGNLYTEVGLDQLMSKGLVNARAQNVLDAVSFSASIREGVPKPEELLEAPQ